MTIYFSLLISLIGLLIYILTTQNGKVVEVGRLMFAIGLLAFLLVGVEHVVNVIPR